MNPIRLLGAFLAFMAAVTVLVLLETPDLSTLSITNATVAGIVPVAIVGLLTVSWIKPNLVLPVGGLFLAIIALVMIPTIFEFVSVATESSSDALQTMIQLALPIIILAYIGSLAARRIVR